jgi:hypothetical protein
VSAAEHILEFADLQRLTGYERPADVAKALRQQHVHVFDGRNGPWTTLELLNYAGGMTAANDRDPEAL